MKTNVKFDIKSFERAKKIARLKSEALKLPSKNKLSADIPEEIGIQLTYRCNLRCGHCYQWNESGFFNSYNKSKINNELDIDILRRVLDETKPVKSNLYLWGGEPMIYKHWDQFCKMLEHDPRWTVVCTNGLLIQPKLDSILSISENLALLISLDGFETEHDTIRGKGTFSKIIENIRLLLSLKRQNIFKGSVSVYCVLSDLMIPKMYEFMKFFESLNVDTVYFGFPWYISPNLASEMDSYYKMKFSWLKSEVENPSWHSYTFHLSNEVVNELKLQIALLESQRWNVRIRIQPSLKVAELEDFISGNSKTAMNRSQCLGLANRIDILADGSAGPCKFFPEFSVGNLNEESLMEIWQGEKYNKIRKEIKCGLMPICSKCVILYLNGV